MTENRRYRQVLAYVSETPWAILPSTLMVIREVVARHLAGDQLTPAEIEARVGEGRAKPPAQGGAVAVIPLWGVLVPHAGMMVDVSQEGTGLDAWLQVFRQAMADPEVGSILLHVDSPGGSAALVTEAAAEVRAARAHKPIIAVASTMAASAAYAIAAQADQLIVTPSGMVGSIGVYTIHQDLSEQLAADGVKPTLISAPAGGYKFEDNPFGPLTEEAQAHLQGMVDDYYATFVDDVAKGRNVSPTVVREHYGQGRTLQAKAALAAGMVDGIATYEQVLGRMLAGKPAVPGARALASVGAPAELANAANSPNATLTVVTYDHEATAGTAAAAAYAQEFATAYAEAAPSDTAPPTARGGTMDEHAEATPVEVPRTMEQLAARLDEIRIRQAELDGEHAGRALSEEAQQEFDALSAEYDETEQAIANIVERKARISETAKRDDARQPGTDSGDRVKVYTNAGSRTPENVFDMAAYRTRATSIDDVAALWRDGAKRVNEQAAYETHDQDKVRAFVERLLSKDPSADPRDSFAHRMLTAGNPQYDIAYGKMLLGKPLSSHEEHLIKMAVSNTGLGSESPVPVTIDPTVLLTSDGATNPLRAISRTVTITGNTWQGISSAGVSVAYEAELSVVADQTPDFDAPTAEVQKAHGWVEFSIEVDQDWGSFRAELARMFQDAKDVKEAEKFLFGTGTNEPQGLLAYYDADDAEVIDSDSVGAIGLVDFEALAAALPPRFDSGGRWLANKALYQSVRALAAAASRFDVWVPLAQGFPQSPGGSGAQQYTLLGYPTNVASEMSTALTTGGEEVAILGDFGRGFIIVDRIGLNTELVPLVPQTGGRPRGSRGLYVYFRNTSQVVARNAFRILRVATT